MTKINPTTNQQIPEPDDGASAIQNGVPAGKNETTTFEPKQAAGRTPEVTQEVTPEITSEITPEITPEATPEKTAKKPELPRPDPKKSRPTTTPTPTDRTGPKRKDGSPSIKPCANTEVFETAKDESPSEIIPVADIDQTITLPPVPLYLIASVLSREIHTYKGVIREVLIRRAGQHRYLITIVTRVLGGVPDAD